MGDADVGGGEDGYLLVGGGENLGLFERESGLVEKVDAGGRPFEGGNHVSSSLSKAGVSSQQ